jgi:hypothetical protein
MRYIIKVHDDERDDTPDTPWNAALYAVNEDGSTGQILAAAFEATTHEAVEAVLVDVLTYDDVPDWVKP